MNDNFVYINNQIYPITLEFRVLDKTSGKITTIRETLEPKKVATDTTAKMKVGMGSKAEVLSAEVLNMDGSRASLMRPDGFDSISEILKKSVILDIETLGKEGGDTITQLGFYDVSTKKGTMIVAQPQLVSSPEAAADLKFRSKLGKYETLPQGISFKEIKYAETYSKMENKSFQEGISAIRSGAADIDGIEKYLLETDFFQGRYFASEEKLRAAFVERGSSDPVKAVEDLRPIRAFTSALDAGFRKSDVEDLFRASRGELATISNLFEGGFELVTDRSMRNILTQDLPELLRGKITWIANAAFESTQFGAQIDAETKRSFDALNEARAASGMAEIKEKDFMSKFSYGGYETELKTLNSFEKHTGSPLLTKSPMYGVTSGISTSSGKPFFVTGKEFSEARVKSFKSGNFSDLYEVFKRTTGAGDVRDILDLVRMQQSMLIDEGIIQSSNKPSSLSIEVQARLFGVTEKLRMGEEIDTAMNAMFQKELHVGIGDVRLSEYPVLRESLDQLEALEIVRKGLPGSEYLVSEAQQGRGALFRAQVYGHVMERLNKAELSESGEVIEGLHDVMFRQRAGRYALDLAETGSYDMRTYKPGMGRVRQAKEIAGVTSIEEVAIAQSDRTVRTNFNDILEDMASMEDYKSARKDILIDDIKAHFEGTYDKKTGNIKDHQIADFLKKARNYSESSSKQIEAIEARFKGNGSGLREIVTEVKRNNMLRRRHVSSSVQKAKGVTGLGFSNYKRGASRVGEVLKKVPGGFKKGYLATAAVFLGASMIPKEKKKSIFIGDEESYLEANFEASGYSNAQDFENALKARYNSFSGMDEGGIASVLRKAFTDFGSPYRSPEYSISVLDNYKLRREREKYVAAQFGARHFSEEGDVGFFLKSFVDSMFREQMGISRNTKTLLLGAGSPIEDGKYNSLKGNNLIEYKVNERNKIRVDDADTITIQNMRGDRNLKIRLAGIDAPETAHQDRAAQPFAEEAKRIATEMISKAKDVRIVTQPGDSTYGRQVGMVYADGVNVNLELLKRGAAAYLPYKSKAKPQIYNQKAFEEAQERAYASKRGMWRESYFQAYKAISDASNQSVTFNTLVNNSKIAKNGHLMSMRSLMDQAQEMGIDNTMSMQLADLGKTIGGSQDAFSPDSAKNNWSEMNLQTYGSPTNSILSILDRQKYELGSLMRTRGSSTSSEKNKAKKVSKRNVELASDTMAKNSYSNETATRQNIQRNSQQRKLKRLETMQYMQQNALRNQFNSPIGHHRM
jgi:endonuclease YncB( thermonuclease family)